MPRFVNTVATAPILGRLTKLAAGIAQQRAIPAFATETFRHWFARNRAGTTGRRVILWPDTFNDHFHPGTLAAAADVLARGGCAVDIPRQALCCGRPLYDFGMLGLAKRQLRSILDGLRDDIRAGTAVIGIEPSCVSVLRDELVNLFPEDDDARRLARQTFTLGEFLTSELSDFPFPRLDRDVLLHGHCHQKSVLSMSGEREALARMGTTVHAPATGCCGMAGAFGFEAAKADLSVAIGERVLLPAVRDAAPETIIAADGFSCREQIRQCTGRQALHLAEIIQLALREEDVTSRALPERTVQERRPTELTAQRISPTTLVAGAGIAAAGAWLVRRSTRTRKANAQQAAHP